MLARRYRIKVTFTEPILGTTTKDPQVYESYIAGKAALTDEELAEELEAVEKIEARGWTGFLQFDNGDPFLLDYVVKGFLKDVCSMLRRDKREKIGSVSKGLTAFKKVIDGMVFIEERKIPLVLPEGGELGLLQREIEGRNLAVIERPLRAQTAQGERVTLARSDTCPPGTTMTFTLRILGSQVTETMLAEWFGYGELRGFGQWRNAGWGTFGAEAERLEDVQAFKPMMIKKKIGRDREKVGLDSETGEKPPKSQE